MKSPALAEIALSPPQRQEWTEVVAAVARELDMDSPPPVEFDCTPKMNGAARYDSDRDVVTMMGGWITAQPDPHSLASRALIAHELGHRLDRARIRRHRRVLIAAVGALSTVFVVVLLSAFVRAIADADRFGPSMPLWVGWLPFVLIVLLAVLCAAVKWPDEFRADATAASVYGAAGVHAYLDVFDEHADSRFRRWPSPTHPSNRMRRARQQP